MSHATDSTCECLVEHHVSNELGYLNLRELNFKIIHFKVKNNSPNLKLKANETNAIESFHFRYNCLRKVI